MCHHEVRISFGYVYRINLFILTLVGGSPSTKRSSHVTRSVASAPQKYTSDDKDRLLKEELTAINYKRKFQLLLDAEKQEHSVQLAKK